MPPIFFTSANPQKCIKLIFETYQIFVLPCTHYIVPSTLALLPHGRTVSAPYYTEATCAIKLKAKDEIPFTCQPPVLLIAAFRPQHHKNCTKKIELFNRKVKTFLDFFVFGGIHYSRIYPESTSRALSGLSTLCPVPLSD